MKYTKRFFTGLSLLVVSALLVLSACEKVTQPVLENPNNVNTQLDFSLCPSIDPVTYEFPEFVSSDNAERNVMIEDYTGHSCPNCPPAATLGKSLEAQYPGRVHLIAVHAGPGNGFQGVDAEHPVDFTTEAGDTYIADITPTNPGNPTGTINRVAQGTFGIWQLTPSWTALTESELTQPVEVNIHAAATYCDDGNALFIHTGVEKEIEDLEGDFRIVVYLLRQEVISPQSFPAGGYEEEYEHHNVLTDNVNGIWGSSLSLDTLEVNEISTLDFSYPLPGNDDTFDIENIALMAFVVDRSTERVLMSKFLDIQ